MSDPAPERVVIRGIKPAVECGLFPVKRVLNDVVDIEADVFADGHDVICCAVQFRFDEKRAWTDVPMEPIGNDHWIARFEVRETGTCSYRLRAWPDPFLTWHRDLLKRIEAGQDISADLQIGAALLIAAAGRASAPDSRKLRKAAEEISREVLNANLIALAAKHADLSQATISTEHHITVDRLRAQFSTWYELFPRSCAGVSGRHGSFQDCENWLPDIAAMGFDVLYLPPIHPVGTTNRKGPNNTLEATPDDPGSPWAIGSSEGGHQSIHPELGTLEDFKHLVRTASLHGIEIALDIAYQCSPDHPYIKEHPEWFRHRPDGSVQYAENPPKKYQDIYPFDFDTPAWHSLWQELRAVVKFWIDQGVRIFRIDNPHTKPFAFWQWMIGDLKKEHPDLIFLAEAFTRPNIMYHLAKLGFTQSYTYFTWRNTKAELTEYFTELAQPPVRDFFRPCLWPENTPDILHEYLQNSGRAAFMTRLVLAATLSGNYGIYGPAYEHCENEPKGDGSEEYLFSEKYEIKVRDMGDPQSLRRFIGRVNAIRKEHLALQTVAGLKFQKIDNDQIICYSKGRIIVAVNLDRHSTQAGFIELDLDGLGIDHRRPYRVTDLLSGAVYTWQGPRNYVELRPHEIPAHILRLGDG